MPLCQDTYFCTEDGRHTNEWPIVRAPNWRAEKIKIENRKATKFTEIIHLGFRDPGVFRVHRASLDT